MYNLLQHQKPEPGVPRLGRLPHPGRVLLPQVGVRREGAARQRPKLRGQQVRIQV